MGIESVDVKAPVTGLCFWCFWLRAAANYNESECLGGVWRHWLVDSVLDSPTD
jgi:hypothetical protein